jgi:S1-C subfamily serine protease
MTDRRVRIGVGSRFIYDGETVVIVEMHAVGAASRISSWLCVVAPTEILTSS